MRLLYSKLLKGMQVLLFAVLLITGAFRVQAGERFISAEEAPIRIDSISQGSSMFDCSVTITNVSGGPMSDISVCFSLVDEKDDIVNYGYASDYSANLENNESMEMDLYMTFYDEGVKIRAMSCNYYDGRDKSGSYHSDYVENWYETAAACETFGLFLKKQPLQAEEISGNDLDMTFYTLPSKEEYSLFLEPAVCIKNMTDHPICGATVYYALRDKEGHSYDQSIASIGGFLKPGQSYWETVMLLDAKLEEADIVMTGYSYNYQENWNRKEFGDDDDGLLKKIEFQNPNGKSDCTVDALVTKTKYIKVYQSGMNWKNRIKSDEDYAYFWVENCSSDTIKVSSMKFEAFDASGNSVKYTYGSGYEGYLKPGKRTLQEVSLYGLENAEDLHLVSYTVQTKSGGYNPCTVSAEELNVSDEDSGPDENAGAETEQAAPVPDQESPAEGTETEADTTEAPEERSSSVESDIVKSTILHVNTSDAGTFDVRIVFPADMDIVKFGLSKHMSWGSHEWNFAELMRGEISVDYLNSVSLICSTTGDHTDQKIKAQDSFNIMMEDASGKAYLYAGVPLAQCRSILLAGEGDYAYPIMEDASGIQTDYRRFRMKLYNKSKTMYTDLDGVKAYRFPDDSGSACFTYNAQTPLVCYGERYGVSNGKVCTYYITEIAGEYAYVLKNKQVTKDEPVYDRSSWTLRDGFRMRCPDGLYRDSDQDGIMIFTGNNIRILVNSASQDMPGTSGVDSDWINSVIEEALLNSTESSLMHDDGSNNLSVDKQLLKGCYLRVQDQQIRHTTSVITANSDYRNAEIFAFAHGNTLYMAFCAYNGDSLPADVLKSVLTIAYEG